MEVHHKPSTAPSKKEINVHEEGLLNGIESLIYASFQLAKESEDFYSLALSIDTDKSIVNHNGNATGRGTTCKGKIPSQERKNA